MFLENNEAQNFAMFVKFLLQCNMSCALSFNKKQVTQNANKINTSINILVYNSMKLKKD